MKIIIFRIGIVLAVVLGFANEAHSQTYVKLNGLYALVGVINPALEFVISPKTTFQTEVVISPWKQVGDYHALFGIFMNEYRYYFKRHNSGWYLGVNAGMMIFDMSKPYLDGLEIKVEPRYCKGSGFMFGACGGYEYQFGNRWVMDVFFGWSYMLSNYNGYSNNGQIDMNPNRPQQPQYPDPYNASAEWYPNKIGISIGYRIFTPKNKY